MGLGQFLVDRCLQLVLVGPWVAAPGERLMNEGVMETLPSRWSLQLVAGHVVGAWGKAAVFVPVLYIWCRARARSVPSKSCQCSTSP